VFDWNRFFANLVRWSYLIALALGAFMLFSGMDIDSVYLNLGVRGATAVALLMHEFLQQKVVRSLWHKKSQTGLTDDARQVLTKSFRQQFTILLVLTGLNIFNTVNRLSLIATGHILLPTNWLIVVQGVTIPVLFLLSSLLVEAEEDASSILRRAAVNMQKSTMRTVASQWRARLARAKKADVNLATVSATLMKDAGSVADAQRIALIDSELSRAEGRPQPVGRAKSRDLYSVPAQATSGTVALALRHQNTPQNGGQIEVVRMPRHAIKKSAKERVFAVLDAVNDPSEVIANYGPAKVAKLAKVSESTAAKWRNQWLEDRSIQLAV
jgi:hypothetical protein